MPFTNGDRRDLFRSMLGDWVERMVERTERRVVPQRYTRPPGALPEVAFLAACTRCGACVTACPPRAINLVGAEGGLAAGTPALDLARQPCSACPDMPCVRACPTPALTAPPGGWADFRLATVEFVPERCLTYRDTECRACADACPVEGALVIDEWGHPALRRETCVGCGTCAWACVVRPSSFRLLPPEG